MSASGWIGVDLDGTLAHYDRWRGVEHVGAPIAPMVQRVKQWRADGVAVKVFTARVSVDAPEVRKPIEEWCKEHIGEVLPITCTKDFAMVELWDDRCVQVVHNTGVPVGR